MPTILLVDDSESIRAQLAAALAGAGHEVITAADGREAIRLLASWRPDLIVTDIYMPDVDGLQLLVALQRIRPCLPVIAMSSNTGTTDILSPAKILGAKKILQKPFPPAELVRQVQALLDASKPARSPKRRQPDSTTHLPIRP